MATLNTPSLYSVSAFDPNYEYMFEFFYTGNQFSSNRAVITDNSTQQVIYDAIQDGYKPCHVLPANTLVAGNSYTIQIQVFDTNENSSDLSGGVLFYCYSTPSFYFSNVSDGDVISSANYEIQLAYSQSETETLSEYQYYVYDITKTQIYSSKAYYTEENLSHTIYGLENNSTYYVRAIGNTAHGMSLDTGYIKINIKYNTLEPNMSFSVTNDKKTGCIVLESNILTVKYYIDNEDYTIDNGKVYLENNTLTYEIGADNDFCLVLKAEKLPIGKFLYTTNDNIAVSIVCISDKYYCNLHVNSNVDSYDIYKELIGVTTVEDELGKSYLILDSSVYAETIITFEIYRANNVYDIQISYE